MAFIECRVCAAKPGSPELCPSCLSNRTTISQLESRIDKIESSPAFIFGEIVTMLDEIDKHQYRMAIVRALSAYFQL